MDNSDESCPICFEEYDNVRTRPETCVHEFHEVCIKKWAERASNTCPTCRTKFTTLISKLLTENGKIIETKEAVEEHEISEPSENEEEPDYTCEICHTNIPDDDAVTLICDGCESGYHMFCLTPPVYVIPVHSWYCPDCVEQDNIQIRVDSIMREAPENVRYSGCTLCDDKFPNDVVIGCLTCERQFHPACYNSERNLAEPRYTVDFCSRCRLIAPASEFQIIKAKNSRVVKQEVEQPSHYGPAETIAARFRDEDDFVLGSDSQIDQEFEGRSPPRSMPSFFSRRRREEQRQPRARSTRGRRRRRRTRRGRRSRIDRIRTDNEIREEIARERHQSPQYRLGITYNPGLEYFEDNDEPIHARSPPKASSNPVPKQSSNVDLLGGILDEQEKTLAPGSLFKQENGKFVPRSEFEKYKNAITNTERKPKAKPWPGLTGPRSEGQGRSDGKPSVPASKSVTDMVHHSNRKSERSERDNISKHPINPSYKYPMSSKAVPENPSKSKNIATSLNINKNPSKEITKNASEIKQESQRITQNRNNSSSREKASTSKNNNFTTDKIKSARPIKTEIDEDMAPAVKKSRMSISVKKEPEEDLVHNVATSSKNSEKSINEVNKDVSVHGNKKSKKIVSVKKEPDECYGEGNPAHDTVTSSKKSEQSNKEVNKDISGRANKKSKMHVSVKKEPEESYGGENPAQNIATSSKNSDQSLNGNCSDNTQGNMQTQPGETQQLPLPSQIFAASQQYPPFNQVFIFNPASNGLQQGPVGFVPIGFLGNLPAKIPQIPANLPQLPDINCEKQPPIKNGKDKRNDEKIIVKHLETLAQPIMKRAFREDIITNNEYKDIMRVFIKEAFKRKWSDATVLERANSIVKHPKSYKKILGLKDN